MAMSFSIRCNVILILLLSLIAHVEPVVRASNSSVNQILLAHIYDLDKVDDIITTYMRERKIPGASVAISREGQFLMRKGYGRASAQRLMTPWALMRIGSVSKVVTAIGVLRLHDEGRIDLDSKIFGTNVSGCILSCWIRRTRSDEHESDDA